MQWTTRDGRQIEVAEMTDSHLVNTINMLEHAGIRSTIAYLRGPEPQGEHALDAYTAELDNNSRVFRLAGLIPIYEEMRREALSRSSVKKASHCGKYPACDLHASYYAPEMCTNTCNCSCMQCKKTRLKGDD